MIGPLFSAHVRIAFTLHEHILVILEIGIQQRQNPMSEESDLALEETEENGHALVSLRGWVQDIT